MCLSLSLSLSLSQIKARSVCLATTLGGGREVGRGRATHRALRGFRGGTSLHLGGEVVLLQLPPFAQVPGPDRVVQAAGPELDAIVRNVNTAGPVCVALELPDKTNQIE